MKVRCKQKRAIKKLKDGTPWSIDLLGPVSV